MRDRPDREFCEWVRLRQEATDGPGMVEQRLIEATDRLVVASDEIDRLRVALARICCEAHCNHHNIADAALGRPTAQEKWSIIKADEAKEGNRDIL